jgi:hypothetical protein
MATHIAMRTPERPKESGIHPLDDHAYQGILWMKRGILWKNDENIWKMRVFRQLATEYHASAFRHKRQFPNGCR